MSDQLQGAVCQAPNTCTTVKYFPFVAPSGVAALQTAVTATLATQPPSTHVIVFGYSNGAEVAEKWLKQHLTDPNMPPPSVLSFVVMGNPTRACGGSGATLAGEVWPTSDYQVIDIAHQYDGPDDFPNNKSSRYYYLAVRNAHRGFISGLHDYKQVNIDDPANAVWTSADGNITYVLVPTQYVPILGGLAPLMPSLNDKLKAEIETAYIRPVPFPATTQTPTTTQAASPAIAATAAASVVPNPVASAPPAAPPPATVPLSVAPAPRPENIDPTPTATAPRSTAGINTVQPAADTVDTTPPAVAAAAAQTATSPAAQSRVENSSGATGSTTAPTTDTLNSTAEDTSAASGAVNGTQVNPKKSHGSLTTASHARKGHSAAG